ncbi:hypothetical protein FHR36_004019 [Kitasatospora paracochleata]|uniref:Secreted protein n=1 Tax=Kitasatospora paracochleata TaxID=58354 RepID=A0ABT1J293_9ACTN|nr:hypothetical protein [Kitasatospora paracochleata]
MDVVLVVALLLIRHGRNVADKIICSALDAAAAPAGLPAVRGGRPLCPAFLPVVLPFGPALVRAWRVCWVPGCRCLSGGGLGGRQAAVEAVAGVAGALSRYSG